MNNTFDWNRFCKVIRKDFHNLWPMFGTTMIILASLPFSIWMLALVVNHSATIGPDVRVMLIMMVSSLSAIMLPSRLYRTMNLHNEGIYYAMLPASKLEKFLSMLFYTFIVAPVVVYMGSMVIDIILYLLPAGGYRQWLWQGYMGFPVINPAYEFLHCQNGWMSAAIWTSFFSMTAIFLYAATLFKKHKVLYTFLVLYLIEFLCSIILIPVIVSLSHNVDFMKWFYDNFHNWTINRFGSWVFGITTVINTIVALLFTWMSWRRLKKMPY